MCVRFGNADKRESGIGVSDESSDYNLMRLLACHILWTLIVTFDKTAALGVFKAELPLPFVQRTLLISRQTLQFIPVVRHSVVLELHKNDDVGKVGCAQGVFKQKDSECA